MLYPSTGAAYCVIVTWDKLVPRDPRLHTQHLSNSVINNFQIDILLHNCRDKKLCAEYFHSNLMKIVPSIVVVDREQVAKLNYISELAQVLTTAPPRCLWENYGML